MSRKKPPPLACPHCIDSYIVIDHEEGEYRCSVCGEVVREQTIDTRSEWRTFENDSADKGRVGQAESEFTTGGMSARIQRNYALERTGNSHAAASSRSGQLAGQDRRVVDVHRLIGAICSRLQLSRVVLETAKKLSHKVEVENVLPVGRNLPARASACVFAAAKIEGQSRTLKEIFAASETSVTRKDVKFIYKVRGGGWG
jgi:transcription initiation factor TFIIB